MKVPAFLVALILLSASPTAAHAQEYGNMRALDQRAAQVIKQRNDFVVQVLTTNEIPHERSEQGAVVRIRIEGQWLAVSSVEIVPVLRESAEKNRQLIAHELFFHTDGGTLYLVSLLDVH